MLPPTPTPTPRCRHPPLHTSAPDTPPPLPQPSPLLPLSPPPPPPSSSPPRAGWTSPTLRSCCSWRPWQRQRRASWLVSSGVGERGVERGGGGAGGRVRPWRRQRPASWMVSNGVGEGREGVAVQVGGCRHGGGRGRLMVVNEDLDGCASGAPKVVHLCGLTLGMDVRPQPWGWVVQGGAGRTRAFGVAATCWHVVTRPRMRVQRRISHGEGAGRHAGGSSPPPASRCTAVPPRPPPLYRRRPAVGAAVPAGRGPPSGHQQRPPVGRALPARVRRITAGPHQAGSQQVW